MAGLNEGNLVIKNLKNRIDQLKNQMSISPLPKNPLVSVIVPNYNDAEFIEATISSILNQSYKNFELLIIDGESTDGSLDILRKYDSDARVSWRSQPDVGPMDAIFNGFEMANGDLLATIPSNDIYIPDAFSIMVGELLSDSQLTFVGGWFEGIDTEGKRNNKSRRLRQEKSDLTLDEIIVNDRLPHINASIFRRDIAMEVIRTGLDRRVGDTIFTIQYMLESARMGGRSRAIPNVVHNNRTHPNNRGTGIAVTLADRVDMRRGSKRFARMYRDILSRRQIRSMCRWGYQSELRYRVATFRVDPRAVTVHWPDSVEKPLFTNPSLSEWERRKEKSMFSKALSIVPPLVGYIWFGGLPHVLSSVGRKLRLLPRES